MVKSYLRYALQDSFGTVASRTCRSVAALSQDYVVTGHDERVSVWNCRTGEARVHFECKPSDLHAPADVTSFVCADGSERWLYVGYADGSIRRFERPESLAGEAVAVVNEDFNVHGHKGRITCLALSHSRQLLASGSQDCCVIIWDTTGDLGLFRLEGHRNEVTDLRFVSHRAGSEAQLKSRKLGAERAPLKQGDDILGFLVSVSKDCIVRVWDLTSQLCIQTVIHSTAELYGLAVNSSESRLYVGGAENRIRCYKLDMTGSEKDEASAYDIPVYAKELPSLNRPETHGRCHRLCVMYPGSSEGGVSGGGRAPSSAGTPEVLEIAHKGLLLCVTNTFVVFYRLYDSKEASKRRKRRQKRVMEKQRARCSKLREAVKATGRTVTGEFDSLESEISHLEQLLSGFNPADPASELADRSAGRPQDHAATDEVNYMFAVNAFERIASFEPFAGGFAIGHSNNRISVWRVQLKRLLSPKAVEDDADLESMVSLCERVHFLDAVGHPSPIIGLCVAPNDRMVLSFSSDSLKVWNSHTRHCIRTVECKAVTCAYFVAGNHHVMVGTGTGELRVLYLDTCEVDEVYKLAADSTKRSSELDVVCMGEHPDRASFAAAFRDRCVKVFQYLLKKKGSREVLCLKELSSTTLADDPTDVRYSSDGRVLAVALHDSTIQTFYADTLKPFLSLYGHKLPVTSIDISSDGALLASSSLDKSVKIWGLDFGNIRRSLLGHSGVVVKCRWINNTHYLVTTGLDSLIKLWDCDTYELICQLRGHSTAVRSLAVSSDAHFFVSASDDSTIRFWRRSDEQIFLSEEREKELELQLEHEVVRDDLNQAIPVDRDALLNKATRRTVESVKATEELMRVIDEAEEYRQALADHRKRVEESSDMAAGSGALSRYGAPDTAVPKEPEPPLELFNRTPTEHVMMAVSGLTHSVIHEVLIALPFIYAEKLLGYIVSSLESYSALCGRGHVNLHSVEMASKTALLLVQIYFRQFFALRHQRPLIARLEKLLPSALQHEMDRMLRNKAALEYLKGLLDADALSKRLRDL